MKGSICSSWGTVVLFLALAPVGAHGQAIMSDFDGDGKADPAVWRPSNGTWYVRTSTGNAPPAVRVGGVLFYWDDHGNGWSMQWGLSGDKPIPGDYGGDGKCDCAVYRPSTASWYILFSNQTEHFSVQHGQAYSDLPFPCVFGTGDTKMDIAYYRPSQHKWWYRRSDRGYFQSYSVVNDPPVDNISTIPMPTAVRGTSSSTGTLNMVSKRSGNKLSWLSWQGSVLLSETNAPASEIQMLGDVDSNDYEDKVRFLNGSWKYYANGSHYTLTWGQSGDIPVLADYDGDDKDDFTVFRPSNGRFYLNPSSGNRPNGQWTYVGGGPGCYLSWGLSGDVPIGGPINQ